MKKYILFWVKHLKCLTLFSLIGLAIVTLFFDNRNKLVKEGYFNEVMMDCKVLDIEDEIDCNDRAFVYFLVENKVVRKRLDKKEFLLFQDMMKDKADDTIVQYKFSKEDISPNDFHDIMLPLTIIVSIVTFVILFANIFNSFTFWGERISDYNLDESYAMITVLFFPSLLFLTIIFCLLYGIR